MKELERLAAAAILHAPDADRLRLLRALCLVADYVTGGKLGNSRLATDAAAEVWHSEQMDAMQLRLNLALTDALEEPPAVRRNATLETIRGKGAA